MTEASADASLEKHHHQHNNSTSSLAENQASTELQITQLETQIKADEKNILSEKEKLKVAE